MTDIEKLAKAFADQLLADIGPDNFAAVRAANVTAEAGVCASHDYCDANMTMLEAFTATFGRQPAMLENTGEDDPHIDIDVGLWNGAWDHAKAVYLTAET